MKIFLLQLVHLPALVGEIFLLCLALKILLKVIIYQLAATKICYLDTELGQVPTNHAQASAQLIHSLKQNLQYLICFLVAILEIGIMLTIY